MKSANPNLVFAALLGTCFFACNPSSDAVDASHGPGTLPESGSDFDREVLAIKAKQSSQKEKISAMAAVAARFGHIVSPQVNSEAYPAPREEEIPETGALGKAATVNRYYEMKWCNFNNSFVLNNGYTLKPGQTITSVTTRPKGSTADPFIVALYRTDWAPIGDASQMQIVGLSDDYAAGSLDSRFTWRNNTGVNQWVQVFAFAYAPGFGGTTTLSSTVDGGNRQTMTDDMEGIAIYDDNVNTLPIAGCRGPLSDKLYIRTLNLGDFTYGVMMVNAETMTGAMMLVGGLQPDQSIVLSTPTPSGYPNFMLSFATSQELGGGPKGSHTAQQYQKFSCTQ